MGASNGLLIPLVLQRGAGYQPEQCRQNQRRNYPQGRADAFLSPGVLIGFDIAAVLLGLIGGVIALRLLRKNFARAGLA